MQNKMREYQIDDGYYIWGAGTSAAMMVQLGIINLLEVKGVVGSNLNYERLEAYGCKIVQPKDLMKMKNKPILITSQYAFYQIYKNITELCPPNKVINLFTIEGK